MSFDPNYLRPNKTISRPLIYPTISGQGTYTNVLLIDNQVTDYQQMVDSVNASTFPIVYSVYSQKNELLALLQANFITIERIGLAFISSLEKPKFFLDKQPLFIENETQPYSENVQFLLDIITQFQVKNVDYLACDTLNYSNWNAYYDLLKQNTTAVIGASSDKTGNIYYGGNWVLESTSEDIEMIYFTSAIQYYAYLLDNPSWATSANGLKSPITIAIDPTNTYAYVNSTYTNTIVRISIANPTNYIANWLVDISNSYSSIIDFVIDSTNTYMYVSCDLYSTYGFYIYKIPINNPSGYTIFKTLSAYSFITIDSTDTYIYVGFQNVISKISLSDPDGDYVPNWATSAQGLYNIKALKIDPVNAYIYANNIKIIDSVFTNIKTKISITNPTTDYTAEWHTSALDLFDSNFEIDSYNTYMYVCNGNPYANVTQISISNPSNSIIYANSSQGLYQPRSIALDPPNTYMYVTNYTGGGDSLGTISQISLPLQPSPNNNENNPCFLHNTKILTDKGYVEIQSLRKGDRIQTLCHGFVPIDMIGFKYMYHPALKERITDQLYKYSSTTHPEIFEDLVITGCHSILIEEFTDSKQRDKTNEVLGDIFITDDKYRLPACVDENSKIYETPGKYIIYHFALEHEDYYMNYGVFANGLLVETTSKRYMKELSNMTLFP